MKAIHFRHFLIGLTMLAAAGLTLALTPRLKVTDHGPKINLEAMIPKQFGGWKQEEETIVPFIGGPEVKAALDMTYTQTLTRNYVNNKGERIMLSMAYGDEQRGSTKAHRPEACYAAQGFQIGHLSKDSIDFSGAKLPVMKLVATHGLRVEPITYWVMVGDLPVLGVWEYRFARLKYGLTGEIPYGMVIRVSTISANELQSYRIEEQFVREMLEAMPTHYREILGAY